MKRLLAALAALLLSAMPVKATASIAVNEPGPYAKGDTITLAVSPGKLKGYQYPVVILRCDSVTTGENVWTYFRRWEEVDDSGFDETGPEPVLLGGDPSNTSIAWNSVGGDATCSVELYAYGGLSHPNPVLLAAAPSILVSAP